MLQSNLNDKIDFSKLLDRLNGDNELLSNTIRISLLYFPTHLNNLKEAINKMLPKEIEISAHTIKGSLSLYSLEYLVDMALEIEIKGRKNQLEGITDIFEKFELEFSHFMDELNKYYLIIKAA